MKLVGQSHSTTLLSALARCLWTTIAIIPGLYFYAIAWRFSSGGEVLHELQEVVLSSSLPEFVTLLLALCFLLVSLSPILSAISLHTINRTIRIKARTK
jgi:hypothetical protein